MKLKLCFHEFHISKVIYLYLLFSFQSHFEHSETQQYILPLIV